MGRQGAPNGRRGRQQGGAHTQRYATGSFSILFLQFPIVQYVTVLSFSSFMIEKKLMLFYVKILFVYYSFVPDCYWIASLS